MTDEQQRGASERPISVALVICNEVIEDKRTNNKTLVGLFNGIIVHGLPAMHPRMFIMASLTCGIGRWPLELRLVSPNNEPILKMNSVIDFTDPNAVNDMVLELRNIPLVEEGQYIVDVLAGTEPIAERRFFVKLMPAGSQS